MKKRTKVELTADTQGFYEELQKETPRAAVILAAAFLDAQLHKLIESFLVDDPKVVRELLGDEKQGDKPQSFVLANHKREKPKRSDKRKRFLIIMSGRGKGSKKPKHEDMATLNTCS